MDFIYCTHLFPSPRSLQNSGTFPSHFFQTPSQIPLPWLDPSLQRGRWRSLQGVLWPLRGHFTTGRFLWFSPDPFVVASGAQNPKDLPQTLVRLWGLDRINFLNKPLKAPSINHWVCPAQRPRGTLGHNTSWKKTPNYSHKMEKRLHGRQQDPENPSAYHSSCPCSSRRGSGRCSPCHQRDLPFLKNIFQGFLSPASQLCSHTTSPRAREQLPTPPAPKKGSGFGHSSVKIRAVWDVEDPAPTPRDGIPDLLS